MGSINNVDYSHCCDTRVDVCHLDKYAAQGQDVHGVEKLVIMYEGLVDLGCTNPVQPDTKTHSPDTTAREYPI